MIGTLTSARITLAHLLTADVSLHSHDRDQGRHLVLVRSGRPRARSRSVSRLLLRVLFLWPREEYATDSIYTCYLVFQACPRRKERRLLQRDVAPVPLARRAIQRLVARSGRRTGLVDVYHHRVAQGQSPLFPILSRSTAPLIVHRFISSASADAARELRQPLWSHGRHRRILSRPLPRLTRQSFRHLLLPPHPSLLTPSPFHPNSSKASSKSPASRSTTSARNTSSK